jgi:hypothetical protein
MSAPEARGEGNTCLLAHSRASREDSDAKVLARCARGLTRGRCGLGLQRRRGWPKRRHRAQPPLVRRAGGSNGQPPLPLKTKFKKENTARRKIPTPFRIKMRELQTSFQEVANWLQERAKEKAASGAYASLPTSAEHGASTWRGHSRCSTVSSASAEHGASTWAWAGAPVRPWGSAPGDSGACTTPLIIT